MQALPREHIQNSRLNEHKSPTNSCTYCSNISSKIRCTSRNKTKAAQTETAQWAIPTTVEELQNASRLTLELQHAQVTMFTYTAEQRRDMLTITLLVSQ